MVANPPDRLWIWPPLIDEMGSAASTDRPDEGCVAYLKETPDRAAAPDLLAALKVILEMADEIDDAGPTGASYQSDWWREQLRKAHEAIVKAEGRSTE